MAVDPTLGWVQGWPSQDQRDEHGFTFIEIMVIMITIAILLAISIPTYFGVATPANDRAAQSNLMNGLTDAMVHYEDAGQTYSGILTVLSASAREFSWNAPTSACTTSPPNCISVATYDVAASNDQQGVVIAAMSETRTCWWVSRLEATPNIITSGETGSDAPFDSGTSGHTGYQNGVALAGTYYAEQQNSGAGNCQASYPETHNAGFTWGTSFSTAAKIS